MPDLGKYAVTVLSAYSVTGVVMFGLLGWSVLRARVAKRRLAALEAARGGK